MVSLGLYVRIHDLVVEKLCALRLARNPPIVIVEKTTEEAELTVLSENVNFHEVAQLTDECPYSLFEQCNVVFDLGS